MTMAVAVEVEAVPVQVAVPVVVVTMPVVVVVMPVMVVTMPVVVVVVTMVTVGTVVTAAVVAVAAVTTAAVMAVAAAVTATVRTRIGSRGDESCQADDERRGEGEECSTFEHFSETFGFETFWLDVNHPSYWSENRGNGFNRLIFGVFSFI